MVLLLKEKAELLERGSWTLHSESSTIARPVVIRLVTYVHVPRDAHRRKITRRAVFARDGWTCQYCGSRSNLTVDHVVPRSKGGTSSWENIVASCAPCNRRKGDRLPRQAGMHPRHAPRTPRAEIFISVRAPRSPRRGCSTCRRRRSTAARLLGCSERPNRCRAKKRGAPSTGRPSRSRLDWKGRDGCDAAAGGTRSGGRRGVSRVGFR